MKIEKYCQKHGLTLHRKRNDQKNSFRCMKCDSERVTESRRKSKLTLIEEHGGKCVNCGYNRYFGALQFHHIDPSTKSFNISSNTPTRSITSLRAEAQKCVLLCANCHAEIEAGLIEL